MEWRIAAIARFPFKLFGICFMWSITKLIKIAQKPEKTHSGNIPRVFLLPLWRTLFNPLSFHTHCLNIGKWPNAIQLHFAEKWNAFPCYNLTSSESVCIEDAENPSQNKNVLAGVKVHQKSSRREVTWTQRTHRKTAKFVALCIVSLVFQAAGNIPSFLSEAQFSTVERRDVQITLSSSL